MQHTMPNLEVTVGTVWSRRSESVFISDRTPWGLEDGFAPLDYKPSAWRPLALALEKGAAQAGGRVVGLLGNHEMMNIMGDLRYVNPMNYARIADGNSEKRQKAAYDEYVKWRGGHASLLAELPQPMELTGAEWMARHPAGFIEQREALGPKGEYGECLRGHAAVAEIEGIIFLHGGISSWSGQYET